VLCQTRNERIMTTTTFCLKFGMPIAKRLTVLFSPACVAFALFTGTAKADLPEGYGKAATVRVCGSCHSPERATSLHQGRQAWEETVTKMAKLGAQGTEDDFDAILSYLSKNFGLEVPGPLNINKATSVDLETTLLLRRSQARAVIQYRSQNGDFKSIDDLRNVPGLDFAKIEAKKARIVFAPLTDAKIKAEVVH
jgi:competence protein ComEA